MKTVSIFGSTGSIGTSTAELVSDHLDQYSVKTLVANSNIQKLVEQAVNLRAEQVVINDEAYYEDLKSLLKGHNIGVAAGKNAVIDAAKESNDWVMASIMGMAGLSSLVESIKSSKVVAIANKEPLVSAGAFIMNLAKDHGCTLMPVDSEHNAVFQCFENQHRQHIQKVVLTASGGPFLNTDANIFDDITPEQAVKHPNWSMGAKISVDSATLMNKAFEVIEAKYFFDLDPAQIDVLVHPQSIVHAMVEYSDGSVLAHLGPKDMKTPIAHCLAFPDRMQTNGQMMDWTEISKLEFIDPDHEKFPSLKMAYECLEQGQWACVALNASNEIAVDQFLKKKIKFSDIFRINRSLLDKSDAKDFSALEHIISYDTTVREKTLDWIGSNL